MQSPRTAEPGSEVLPDSPRTLGEPLRVAAPFRPYSGWVPVRSGFLGQYASPIGSGALAFVAAAIILLIPYTIVQYRRRGRVGGRRIVVESLFLLYLLCAWALVVLPLPDITGESCVARQAAAQTTAFQWADETWRAWQWAGGEPLDLLRSKSLWIRVFNVALLVPFGVFLRRWWRRGFTVTTFAGFLLSMGFELTQLTGSWGIYPCAYRSFDVDDLMANTLGAALGWLIAPMFVLLPARTDADDSRPEDERPTLPRRLVADLVDLALIVVGAVPLTLLLRRFVWNNSLAGAVALAIIVMLMPVVFAGRTPGKALVRLRVVSSAGSHASWWRIAVRGAVLWLPLIAPVWVLDGIDVIGLRESRGTLLLFVALLVTPPVWTLVVLVTVIRRSDDRGPHDLAAGTTQEVS